MDYSPREDKPVIIRCRSCGYTGALAVNINRIHPCACCNMDDVEVLDDCDPDELSVINCRCCGYYGVPGLNLGPSSEDYPLCCPRCSDINDMLVRQRGDSQESWGEADRTPE